jgi:hypothetical protein
MTTTPATIGTRVEVPQVEDRAALGAGRVALDIWLLAERNLLKVWRNKRLIIFSTVQPIMQLILFAFVFGAIANHGNLGFSYKDLVVPAVIIQTVVFTGVRPGHRRRLGISTLPLVAHRSLGVLLKSHMSDTLQLVHRSSSSSSATLIVPVHGSALGAIACPSLPSVRDVAHHILGIHGLCVRIPNGRRGGVRCCPFFTSSVCPSPAAGLDAAGGG